MQTLLDAAVDLVSLISPAKVSVVASALRGLQHRGEAPSASSLVDTAPARFAVERVLEAWVNTRASGDEVSGMLVGASAAASRTERELGVELVWTGPTTRYVPTRRTEQVLLDLISGATEECFLISFVAYDIPSVVAALNEAAGRGVRLGILLEASASHGGSLGFDPAAIMRSRVPAAELFSWKKKSEPFVDGKVHAKVVVVDGLRSFITSANLTNYALEKNMEAGVLIHGGPVPRTLKNHLEALIDVGIIDRV